MKPVDANSWWCGAFLPQPCVVAQLWGAAQLGTADPAGSLDAQPRLAGVLALAQIEGGLRAVGAG